MSSDLFNLGMRLRARHETRILPATATKRISWEPDARVITVLAQPGDHGAVWAIAVGMTRTAPAVIAVGDPRSWQAQAELWHKLGERLTSWLQQCINEERYPTLITTDRAALDRLADSARRVVRSENATATARAAARWVILTRVLARTAGQQVAVPLVEALREHYITGADAADEYHLRLWATWPNLPDGWDEPMTSIPPNLDAEGTSLLKNWRRLQQDDVAMRDAVAGQVAAIITPILKTRHKFLLDAAALLDAHPGRTLPSAVQRARAAARSFAYWSGQDGKAPHPGSKINTLAEREHEAEAWLAALREHDPVELARGAADGDVLDGWCDGNVVTSGQPLLRLRAGDQMYLRDSGEGWRESAKVESVTGEAGAWTVVFDRVPAAGRVLAWSRPGPMPKMRSRDQLGWTHNPNAAAPEVEAPSVAGKSLLAEALAARRL